METNIFCGSVRIPASRGRITVPSRDRVAKTQNIALDSAGVKPTVVATSSRSLNPKQTTNYKLESNRVTFDTIAASKSVQSTPITTTQSIPTPAVVPAPPTTSIQTQPQLQTAVRVASEQPTSALPSPMNLNGGDTVAVPMVQVAPIQEVAVTPIANKKKSKSLKIDFKKPLSKIKDNVKKINIKQVKNIRPVKLNVSAGDIVRYAVVALVLIVSGYLAYDTWTTNQQAKDIFSQSVAATDGGGDVVSGASATSAEPVYTVAANMPKYLSIPKIGISNARVEQVGLLDSNKIDTPKDLNNVAWYDGSAKPGENGAAFINGHINDVGAGGIFDGLKNVAVGDNIMVERGDGTKFNYKVVDTVTVPTSSIDMSQVLQTSGNSEQGLNLMTCAGTYNFNSMSYSHRVIVYSVRA